MYCIYYILALGVKFNLGLVLNHACECQRKKIHAIQKNLPFSEQASDNSSGIVAVLVVGF